MKRKVVYHLSSGKAIECACGFLEVCQGLLKYHEFVQAHRSYLVNMHHISNMKHTEIILQTNYVLPMAKRRAAEIKERYLSFQMEG